MMSVVLGLPILKKPTESFSQRKTTQTVRELSEALDVAPMTISIHLKEREVKKGQSMGTSGAVRKPNSGRYESFSELFPARQPRPTSWSSFDLWQKIHRSRQLKSPGSVVGPRSRFTTLTVASTLSKKIELIVLWSVAGVIRLNFLNPKETITVENYCQKLVDIQQMLRRMCRKLVNMKGTILLHYDTRPHVAQLTLLNLMELGYETLPSPGYSLDLPPTNYHFFKHLDSFLRIKWFKNRNDAKVPSMPLWSSEGRKSTQAV